MIPFIEKTWFFWWILATLAILRWLHVNSCQAEHEGSDSTMASEEATPDRRPPRTGRTPRFGSEHAY